MGLHGYLVRSIYREHRPNAVARFLNRAWATVGAAGLWPGRLVRVEVAGRKSGRRITFPMVVADLQGERYLVSMLGEDVNWVRNVRAAGGHVVIRHGRRETVRLQEVPPESRAAILRRHLEVAPGARPHIPVDLRAPLAEFERIADRFPVFRIVPETVDTATHREPTSSGPGPRRIRRDEVPGRRRYAAMIATAVVALGSMAVLLLLLSVNHTTGGEKDGIYVAGSGVVIGVLSFAFILWRSQHRLARVILVALWVTLALGGIVGYDAHTAVPAPGHAPNADQRPRPPLAPLVFTVFGLVGGAALLVGSRGDRGAILGRSRPKTSTGSGPGTIIE